VNGEDIYEKLYTAASYYLKADYYHFGQEVGEALDEVEKYTTKAEMDTNAYDFLDGFLSASVINVEFDRQTLYNNIDGLGEMIWGPIKQQFLQYQNNKNNTSAIYMSIHEISHSFLEGVNSLVAKGALTEENAK